MLPHAVVDETLVYEVEQIQQAVTYASAALKAYAVAVQNDHH